MADNIELLFEYTIRSFLGEKAFHIAGHCHSEKSRKKWFQKAMKVVIKNIQSIETSTKHHEQLSMWAEAALQAVKKRPYSEIEFTLLVLRLVGTLLGYTGISKTKIVTPAFFQTEDQRWTQDVLEGNDYQDRVNSIKTKKRLITQLKEEGQTDFDISLVLNISEYQVKKLRMDR